MSRVYLKVKIKSLAAEARIIRAEERKLPGPHATRTGLHLHRVNEVRREARAALLAYGFLRGRWYEQIEGPGTDRDAVPWQRVLQLANKYGGQRVEAATLQGWAEGGEPLPLPAKLSKAA